MNRETFFVDVIIPLSVPEKYTYRVPYELNDELEIGKRAIVQFGRKRMYTAIIYAIKTEPNPNYEAKYLDLIIDDKPIISDYMLPFWDWMASYYICNPGEVMNAALPSNLKLSSQTILVAEENLNIHELDLEVEELKLYQLIKESDGTKLEDLYSNKNVAKKVKELIDKNLVYTAEEIKDSYKPRIETFVKLGNDFKGDKGVQRAMDLLLKSDKQLEVLLAYVELSGVLRNEDKEVIRKDLVKRINRSHAALNPLLKKGIFVFEEKEVDRIHGFDNRIEKLPDLSSDQEQALNEIKDGWDKNSSTLLEGVTSSGKTLVYARLIEEALERGEQVLYLLPEIGLTIHLISRLKKYFGSKLGVYHSKFKKDERVEIWNKVLTNDENGGRVILGARSALFLPFTKLSLIIVDEEHDSSLKQYQPAPRYHARDSAIMLAKITDSKIILGSATPSIETRWMATNGKYNWVRLKKRFGDIRLPEIVIADVRKEKSEAWKTGIFSKLLVDLSRHDLEKGHQIIYFQNRRGYAPLWLCRTCGWIPKCEDCDVNLTYHRHNHTLSCHYCGKNYSPPNKCLACGSTKLSMPGYGTERIEDEVSAFFPNKKVARLDLDTTRSRNAYENILDQFANKEVDLLVGTQMVAKGLDFDNVQLVAVLNADQMLNFPDFRAFERAFQMMVQVAGRAGRVKKQGKVLIQTHYPEHWVLDKVKQHDYDSFYKQEIIERQQFKYPPFYRLIRIVMTDLNKPLVENAAKYLAERLRPSLGDRVLGPEAPYISRIRNRFHIHLLLKVERKMPASKLRAFLREELDLLKMNSKYKNVRIYLDVDPI